MLLPKENEIVLNIVIRDVARVLIGEPGVYIHLLYGFEESCILIGRRAVRKNPYSDRGP